MFTQWGPHGRALYGSSGQHQSTQHQAATSHQDQPLFRLIIGGCFYIISPTPPCLFYTVSWWPTRLGRPLLKCLGWLKPRTDRYLEPHKHQTIWPCSPRGQPRQRAEKGKNASKDKALEWERSVLEHVIELIEINIHDWARRLGHLAARLMPTSVTVCAALPAVRAARWGVAGVACLSWVHRARDHRGASVASLLHGRSFTRTLKIWIGGSSEPSPRVWTWLGLEHSHLPAGCLWASVNGGCSTEPRQPPHSPQQLWHHTGPGLCTLMLH